MHFIFLTPGYHPDIDGGSYRYAAEVAVVLARDGHRVDVITRNAGRQQPPREVREGVRIHRVSGGRKDANRQADKLIRELPATTGSERPRIFSHHAWFAPATEAHPCEIFFHGPWGLEYRFQKEAAPRNMVIRWKDAVASHVLQRWERRWTRRAVRICVASRYMSQRLDHWHGPLSSPRVVCGGGADLERFRPIPNRLEWRHHWDANRTDFVWLAVRRLDARMGLKELVAAFGPLAERFPHARLWLAGRGPLGPELEGTIRSNGWEHRVRLLGFVEEMDLPGLYATADAVVMPSLDLEGFGLVTAEASACGTPVLASRSGANPEVLESLDPRLIFPAGDSAALSAIMGDVMSGALPLPTREATANWARSRFDWRVPAQRMAITG